MVKDYFILSIRNLKKRKLRAILTIFAISISIATIFILVSLSLGLQGAVEKQFEQLGSDKFFIQYATGFLGPPGSGEISLTEKDVKTIKSVRGVKDYSFLVIGNAKIEFKGEIRYMNILGIPSNHQKVYFETFDIEDGKFLTSKNENSLIIGNLYKNKDIFGKAVKVGDKLKINGIDFKVKGIMKKIGNYKDDSVILMDLKSFRDLFNLSQRVDFIIIKVVSDEKLKEVAERVESKLRKSRGLTKDTQDFEILTPEGLLKSLKIIINIITVFLAGVAGISLFVGGIGIANTMYTSVIERTKEIGIMKAIGAKNKDILSIFLIEAGLLGFAGSIVGIILGYIISKGVEFIIVNFLNTTLLQGIYPFWLIIGCLLFGCLIGTISGVLPAFQASKTKIIDALRYE